MTVIREEPFTLEEICEPFELARNLPVFELLMAVTAYCGPGAGVTWFCRLCRTHDSSATLLTRPLHCGQQMEIEGWVSLDHLMRYVPVTVDLRQVIK